MPAPKKAEPMVQYIGPFRIELKQLSLNRDLATGTTTGNIQLEAAWEPRLRPMLLKLDYENLKIVDDRKKPVPPQVTDESAEVVVRPENPLSEINLNIAAPERAAKKLASLKVKAELTHPGRHQNFQIPQPGPERRDVQARRRQPHARGNRSRRTSLESERHAGLPRRRPRV